MKLKPITLTDFKSIPIGQLTYRERQDLDECIKAIVDGKCTADYLRLDYIRLKSRAAQGQVDVNTACRTDSYQNKSRNTVSS